MGDALRGYSLGNLLESIRQPISEPIKSTHMHFIGHPVNTWVEVNVPSVDLNARAELYAQARQDHLAFIQFSTSAKLLSGVKRFHR